MAYLYIVKTLTDRLYKMEVIGISKELKKVKDRISILMIVFISLLFNVYGSRKSTVKDINSNNTVETEYKKNNINLELLGIAGISLYSINYEREVFALNHLNHIWLRFGFSGLYLNDGPGIFRNSLNTEKVKYILTFSPAAFYSINWGRRRFEFGLGITPEVLIGSSGNHRFYLYFRPYTSYRKVFKNEKWFVQFSYYPFIDFYRQPIQLGLSVGAYY